MEKELANLQSRVAELEAALAAMSMESRQAKLRQPTALVPLICAGILVICTGILLVRGAAQPVNAQGGSKGPSKVTAPFEVVNAAGKTLFTLGVNIEGLPLLELYNDAGKALVRVGGQQHTSGLELYNDIGQQVLTLGAVANTGDGVLRLNHNGELSALLGRSQFGGLLDLYNGPQKVVATLQATGWGGDLHLRNNGGKDVVAIFSEQGQTGIAQLFDNGGNVKLTLGTLTETRQGDVCAYGDKGSVCLRFVKPNY